VRTDQRIRFRHTRQPITAVEWRVGPADDFQRAVSEIRIVTRLQRDGSTLYAVTQRGWTANKDGEWEYEPIPSDRDEAYIARCRWDDWEVAALMADRMLARDMADRVGA
jgi:hypothetical protein